MPNADSPFLSDVLASPELGRSTRVLETLHPDAAVLTAVALAQRVATLALVVPSREVDAYCRALGERLPATVVRDVHWGDGPFEAGPVVVVDERVFFDGVAAEAFASVLPDFDHWLVTAGDGVVDRFRRALRTTTRSPRVCGFLESRLGLGASVGSTSLVPSALLGAPALAVVPYPLREDPNRVFYLEQTRRGRALRSTVVDAALVLEAFFTRRTATVLGRALSVEGDLGFAMRDLGVEGVGEVDPDATRRDLLLFVPPMPRSIDKEWPAEVIDATRRAAAVPGAVTVLASAWNRGEIGKAIRPQLAAGSATMAHPRQVDAEGVAVLVLDRLPTPSVLEPVYVAERRRTPRWFLELGLPRAVQRFRYLASQVAPRGALVVLDGRIRSKWAESFWRAVPGETTDDWGTYRRWVDAVEGGVR